MAAGSSIKAADKKRYNQLLIQLRLHRNPQNLLEVAALYLESNPSNTVSFNSPKKEVIEKIAQALSPKEESTASYKHCTPNLEIKANEVIHQLDWRAGHDLTGKRNDLKYWRDQLEPQVQSKFFKKGDGHADGRKPVAPARE